MQKYIKRLSKIDFILGAVLISIFLGGFLLTPAAADESEESVRVESTQDVEVEAEAPLDSSAIKWAFLAAAFATGVGSIGAGIAVASVGSAAMGAIAEKPELAGKSLIYVALAEGIAIYGLLISIIIVAKV